MRYQQSCCRLVLYLAWLSRYYLGEEIAYLLLSAGRYSTVTILGNDRIKKRCENVYDIVITG